MTVKALKTNIGATPSERGTLITWDLKAGDEGEPTSVAQVRGDVLVAADGIFDDGVLELEADIGNGSVLPIGAYGLTAKSSCILNAGEKKRSIAPRVIGGSDATSIKVSIFIPENA